MALLRRGSRHVYIDTYNYYYWNSLKAERSRGYIQQLCYTQLAHFEHVQFCYYLIINRRIITSRIRRRRLYYATSLDDCPNPVVFISSSNSKNRTAWSLCVLLDNNLITLFLGFCRLLQRFLSKKSLYDFFRWLFFICYLFFFLISVCKYYYFISTIIV